MVPSQDYFKLEGMERHNNRPGESTLRMVEAVGIENEAIFLSHLRAYETSSFFGRRLDAIVSSKCFENYTRNKRRYSFFFTDKSINTVDNSNVALCCNQSALDTHFGTKLTSGASLRRGHVAGRRSFQLLYILIRLRSFLILVMWMVRLARE